MNNPDRWIRYAARVAIERQPAESWEKRTLEEQGPYASLTGLLALSRSGDKEVLPELITRLNRIDWNSLSVAQQLDLLRIYTLAFVRMGPIKPKVSAAALARLNPPYPAEAFNINRELSELLVYLRAPDVIKKTMNLFSKAKKP